jgi:heat shock protein HtpX
VANASFYAQAGANRLRSFVLVIVIVAILAALGMAIGYGTSGDARVGLGWLGIFGIIAIVTSLAGYYQGSALVLAASKAREVTPEQAPQLYNVVTELALAGGMPMPRVYIIDDSAPNAFATGRDPKHAAIAVTTGLLEKLDREELQGVIGHELSHVRNYDIRYATLVGVLVGTIALVADVFLRMTFWGGFGGGDRDDDNGGGGGGLQLLVFVFAIILAILAPIFARLVQLAVNRQREYLADTSSVELTRNPYGLERALAKISADQDVLEVANRATQHLYFTNPIKQFEKRSKGLFSTHPPIVDRINRLRALTGERPLDEGAVPGVTPGAS